MVVRAKSVKRYVIVATLSIISLFFDLYFFACLLGCAYEIPYVALAILITTRTLCAFFAINHVEDVEGNTKGLLQALAIYGVPAFGSFILLCVHLGVPVRFLVSRANIYNGSFLYVGTVVQDFLRGLLYSQAVRGIPWRAPLVIAILGWHLFAGLTDAQDLMGCILYWLVASMLAYLIFRAEKG